MYKYSNVWFPFVFSKLNMLSFIFLKQIILHLLIKLYYLFSIGVVNSYFRYKWNIMLAC